jgi:outer membrane protein with beta-barrel domain
MSITNVVIAAAVVAGLSAPAMAQEGSGQSVPTPAPVINPVANTGYNNNNYYGDENHWVASGFVGTNFATGFGENLLGINPDDSNASINFGGQVAYLWGGYVGVEGLAEFAPSFEIADVLFENKPNVNTYMANGIVVAHFGSEDQFRPYVSGGFGAVQLRSTVFVIDPVTLNDLGTVSESGSRFGGDFGGGLMGFAGKWGFRGDLRYYKTSADNNIDLTDFGTGNGFTQSVLSGLAFWKANVGVAFRW